MFIGQDIKNLSDADQERLIVVGKTQQVVYDAETVLEGHLEGILSKAERQKRQSIRVPIYAAYAELRNRRVKDRLLNAAEAIRNNQPADILNEQKAALEVLRVGKTGLEAAGAPEKLAAVPLATEVADIDVEDTKRKPGVDETLPPPPLVVADRQGADPLTNAILIASDNVRDLVRRSEYLAGQDGSGDFPRYRRRRFGRLSELGVAAIESLRQAQETAGKANEPYVEKFLAGLDSDLAGVARLIAAKTSPPGPGRSALTRPSP